MTLTVVYINSVEIVVGIPPALTRRERALKKL